MVPDPLDAVSDPRVTDEFVRHHSGDEGDVVLVGAVHDHPASVARVRAVVGALDPSVVALELPALAVPLYRVYANEGTVPPALGGEMSAAVQAADVECVGIDGPSRAFFETLAGKLRTERPSLRTVWRVLRGVAAVSRHAMVSRVAATVARYTGVTAAVDRRTEYDCEWDDPADVQAESEARRVSRSLSLLRAADSPRPVELRDTTREECMADELAALRSEGDVIAVVGVDHLDPLDALLAER